MGILLSADAFLTHTSVKPSLALIFIEKNEIESNKSFITNPINFLQNDVTTT